MASLIDAQFRHAEHYESVMRDINELYLEGGETLKLGLLLFDVERQNIEAGWSTAVSLASDDDEAARLCSSYPRVGAALLNMRIPPRERVRRSQAALAASRRLADRKAENRHLGDLAAAYVALGETEKALECLQRQLAAARESGDRSGAAALGNLGNAAMAERNPAKAADYYRQALTAYRELEFRRGEADALNNLGVACKDLGEFTESRNHHEEALVISQEIGYRRGQGQTLNNLAIIYRKLKDYEKAATICAQALAIFREVGDRFGEAQALWSMAKTNSALGKYDVAIPSGTAALSILEALGTRQASRVRAPAR
jgi:tetratricopeptide (TPR) repeat protein